MRVCVNGHAAELCSRRLFKETLKKTNRNNLYEDYKAFSFALTLQETKKRTINKINMKEFKVVAICPGAG